MGEGGGGILDNVEGAVFAAVDIGAFIVAAGAVEAFEVTLLLLLSVSIESEGYVSI